MNHIIIGGSTAEGIEQQLADAGQEVTRLDQVLTSSVLESAGIESAAVFLLTDATEATAIPLAREQNPDISIIVYSTESIPEFCKPIADMIVHPGAVSNDVLVEEILAKFA